MRAICGVAMLLGWPLQPLHPQVPGGTGQSVLAGARLGASVHSWIMKNTVN